MAYQVRIFRECRLRVSDGNGGVEWKDFREEDLHVPLITSSTQYISIDSTSSNLLYTYNDWTPKKGLITEEIELPIPYNEFLGMDYATGTPKYISISYMGDAEQKFQFYAWIDSAIPVSTKGPSTNTRIRYHINWWHTLQALEYVAANSPSVCKSRSLGLGAGRVKRGPVELARPDPSSPRLWVNDSVINLEKASDTDGPYVIMLFTTTNNGITLFNIAWWGVNMSAVGSYTPIGFDLIYSGFLEEAMDITASSIVGVWFSPIPPNTTGGSMIKHHLLVNVDYGWYEYQAGTGTPYTYTITLNPAIMTDDLQKYILIDPKGTVYATLPWGVECDRIQISADVGSSGAWLDVEFMDGASYIPGEGRRAQIPLISAPITSNDWNEYVLSGQREYDKDMARIQQEKNAWSGVANLGGSIVGGAIGGAIAGGPGGAAAGAAGGIVSGTVGTAGNFWLTEIYDAKAQEKMDKLTSNQTASVIISGGGNNWYKVYAGKWILAKMVRDDVSAAELATEQTELGYVTDCYLTDCTTLIADGAGLRIENLNVKGDISTAAKQYIAALFARGVHLDLIP